MIPFLGWILSAGWSFIKSPMNIVYSAAAVGAGILYLQLQFANHQIAAMAIEQQNLKAQVWTLQAQNEIQAKNDIVLADRLKAQEAETAALNDVQAAIDATPSSEDGPVSDVLKKEISR